LVLKSWIYRLGCDPQKISTAMLSTVIAGAAVLQAFAMRPESQSGSLMIAKLAETIREEPSDNMAAITAASTIVHDIMLEAGNATEHLTGENQKVLEDVMKMIRTSMYGSMSEAHDGDEKDLKKAIDDLLKCNAEIVGLQSPTGILGKLHSAAKEAQIELDRLGGIVETKTEINNTKWDEFQNHMDLIKEPPKCKGIPGRTMPLLDVFFEKSEYSLWFAAQQPRYFEKRDAWKAAHEALLVAINMYNIQQAKLDIHYCDWKSELEARCAAFDECWAKGVAYYTDDLSPRVSSSEQKRIEAYKAGETLIRQIEFLLALKDSSETGEIDASIYNVDFPVLPQKEVCDLSPLTSSIWNPPIVCEEHQDVDCGDHLARSCAYCPQEHGKSFCNGQCKFQGDQCVPKASQAPGWILGEVDTSCDAVCLSHGYKCTPASEKEQSNLSFNDVKAKMQELTGGKTCNGASLDWNGFAPYLYKTGHCIAKSDSGESVCGSTPHGSGKGGRRLCFCEEK